jgi:hypothetical protein
MSEIEIWQRRRKRIQELAVELSRLGEEETGASSAEKRFTRALKIAHRQTLVAAESADLMLQRVGWVDLPPRPCGPNPTCRVAMTVRFACDMLGWNLETAAERAKLTKMQFRRVRDGNGTPETIKKVLEVLSQQGVDMQQLAQIVDNRHAGLRQKAQTDTPEIIPARVYRSPPTGDDDERPMPPWR